jgi:hypothetical protein
MSERIREKPYFSVNKLGEYVAARPARRNSLIRDQKYVNDFAAFCYSHLFSPVYTYLLKGGEDDSPILRGIQKMATMLPNSDWQKRDFKNTGVALNKFLDVGNAIAKTSYLYERGRKLQPTLTIQGVNVSVRPDYLFTFTYKGERRIGGVKLYLTKENSRRLTEYGGQCISTLMLEYLEKYRSSAHTPMASKCFVVDIHRAAVFAAPRTNTILRKEIAAACEEIASRWDGVRKQL